MANEELGVRPLVIGADGLVGRAVSEGLEVRYPHTVSSTRVEIDITDRWRLEAEIERLRPTVVVNCAAMSNLDECEDDPLAAEKLNATGPAYLAAACRNAGIRLVHFSTDYVFDGSTDREYDESDAPNPLSVYGRTKLEGDLAVLEGLPDAAVLRVSFVFGHGRKTFLDKIADQLTATDGEVPALDSWVTRPTNSLEIAHAVEAILDAGETGLWNVANPPAVSRFEFARQVADLLGFDPNRIVPIEESELELRARRPPRSALSTRRYQERFGTVPRPWTEWAREYLSLRRDAPRR